MIRTIKSFARRIKYENPLITSYADRLIHFGQGDHVRVYGKDYFARLTQAGFSLEFYDTFAANGERAQRLGLIPEEQLFVGVKALLKF